jgi:hypothetical protein
MPSPSRRRKVPLIAAGVTGILLLLLVIPLPEAAPPPPPPTGAQGFTWDRDSLWEALEARFVAVREAGCPDSLLVWTRIAALRGVVDDSLHSPLTPEAAVLDSLESRLLALAPLAAACPAAALGYAELAGRIRETVKRLSVGWDPDARATRDRLYRSLYGARAAVEEVMLQQPGAVPALLEGTDEPSAAPGVITHGVVLRSGDIIVSRGGYPTSALIARGNDYPGNFSHVALVHVDEETREVAVVEAHIESGVAISSFEAYLADKKLRLMLLRPRSDLPAIVADPLAPHRAATGMLARARAGHVPYDFAMDYRDPSRLFCSEVASAAYREVGITLWSGISTISGPGLRRWLGAFGVRHFETQEPSDLEYDPQLVVVAEWRDPASLFDDHLDNAVTDVMLEGAAEGEELGFSWYRLPAARLAKGYSWVRQLLGGIGPIPEGMAPAAALRNRAYSDRHARLAAVVRADAVAWQEEHGHPPAYWTLVELARGAAGRSTHLP